MKGKSFFFIVWYVILKNCLYEFFRIYKGLEFKIIGGDMLIKYVKIFFLVNEYLDIGWENRYR